MGAGVVTLAACSRFTRSETAARFIATVFFSNMVRACRHVITQLPWLSPRWRQADTGVTGMGGAVCVAASGPITVVDSTFTSNSAAEYAAPDIRPQPTLQQPPNTGCGAQVWWRHRAPEWHAQRACGQVHVLPVVCAAWHWPGAARQLGWRQHHAARHGDARWLVRVRVWVYACSLCGGVALTTLARACGVWTQVRRLRVLLACGGDIHNRRHGHAGVGIGRLHTFPRRAATVHAAALGVRDGPYRAC